MSRRARRRKRTRTRRVLCLIGWIALAWIGVTWLLVLVLRFVPPPTSAFMLERQASAWIHGEDDFELHYHWVSWSRMSKLAPLAMVASEDQTFPFNHGFDIHAIHTAIEEAEEGDRLRGASTITQQTAKNLFLWGGRSWVRKGIEVYFTVLLDITWPKQRILEVYANIAQFGDGIYGVGAASRLYFHRDAAHLTKRQAALLAAVLPNPLHLHANHPSAYVERRVNWIKQQMQQLGGTRYVTEDDPPRPRAHR
ncbi:MAG TPA: monofunctional biosynthetic peptidoglycan transglycosylase [Oleiagrimonas sp.]|nr:monofunctional biosynthetic peptidoglycan transglycosylase [Oleiagrimonas sp.]